jgi:hypothetical protein
VVESGDLTELEKLAVAERLRCAFVTWTVARERDAVILRIVADVQRPDDVADIAALFGVSAEHTPLTGRRAGSGTPRRCAPLAATPRSGGTRRFVAIAIIGLDPPDRRKRSSRLRVSLGAACGVWARRRLKPDGAHELA